MKKKPKMTHAEFERSPQDKKADAAALKKINKTRGKWALGPRPIVDGQQVLCQLKLSSPIT